jgi:hypothetical protein
MAMKPRRRQLTKIDIKNSDLYGYVRSLLHLGFQLDQYWITYYRQRNSPHSYVRSNWRLIANKRKVVFRISRHGYKLIAWRKQQKELQIQCLYWEQLLPKFTSYFKPNKPVKLRRLTGNVILKPALTRRIPNRGKN